MLECESRSRPGLPEIHILDKAKCGLVAGQKMLIPTLTDIEATGPGGRVSGDDVARLLARRQA